MFGKALRILRTDKRKGRWLVKQDFYGNYLGQCYMVFLPFSPKNRKNRKN